MINIAFENEIGNVKMGGKNNDLWRIRDIEGLETVEANANVVNYVGIVGQETVEVQLKPRIITIRGSLSNKRKESRQYYLTKAIKILNTTMTGDLKLNLKGKTRRINCRPLFFSQAKPTPAGQEFVLSLIADNPYFKDLEDIRVNIYTREDNLISGMEFPRAFTIRTSTGNVNNYGDVKVEPIIKIITGERTESELKGITITNETTGKVLELEYAPVKDEEITIDIANRKITSSINGNITKHKSKETLLSEFTLAIGTNHLTFVSADINQPLESYTNYSNLYIEGVY